MSRYDTLVLLAILLIATAAALYSVFRVFWPVKIDPYGPAAGDDDIYGDASTYGRDV